MPQPNPTPPPRRGPSPIALVGFGAILALGSAAFPWYVIGASQGSGEQSLAHILETGWRWFPGIPLVLIAASAILSTLVAIVGGSSKVRPLVAMGLGMVTLFSAAWLWLGYQTPDGDAGTSGVTPATGAILATMGAIVLVTTLLWMFQTVRFR